MCTRYPLKPTPNHFGPFAFRDDLEQNFSRKNTLDTTPRFTPLLMMMSIRMVGSVPRLAPKHLKLQKGPKGFQFQKARVFFFLNLSCTFPQVLFWVGEPARIIWEMLGNPVILDLYSAEFLKPPCDC